MSLTTLRGQTGLPAWEKSFLWVAQMTKLTRLRYKNYTITYIAVLLLSQLSYYFNTSYKRRASPLDVII